MCFKMATHSWLKSLAFVAFVGEEGGPKGSIPVNIVQESTQDDFSTEVVGTIMMMALDEWVQ